MEGCIIFLVVGALFLILFLLEKCRRYSIKETIIKGLTSLTFVGLGIHNFAYLSFHPLGLLVLIGLICGLFGDIFLELKYSHKVHSRFYTYAGFVSFAIGHIFYITGMMLYLYQSYEWYSFVIPFTIGIMGGIALLLVEKPLKLNYGEYKIITVIYTVFLLSMVGTSGYLAISNLFQITTYNMLFIAGVLFAISDLILSGTYFGIGKERPIDLISNSVTYYAAQFLIAFSLFFIV